MRRRPARQRWTGLGMACGAVADVGGAYAERLWDDPATPLREGVGDWLDRVCPDDVQPSQGEPSA